MFQRKSVASYLSEFRNFAISIPHITDDEKMDRFTFGLKPHVRIEVLKSNVRTFDEATRIALNVDRALFGAGMFRGISENGPVPMEIGNVEHAPRYKGRSLNGNRKRQMTQIAKDIANNACFKCHKIGCRPWKQEESNATNNQIYSHSDEVPSDDDSEN